MMSQHVNQYGQPVGQSMPDWQPRPLPQREVLQGQVCRLEPFSVASHAEALWQAWSLAEDGRDWTYLSDGPFNDEAAWLTMLLRWRRVRIRCISASLMLKPVRPSERYR